MNKLEIENIFKKHWSYYGGKDATDASQITGLTKHIADEYQGRVIYELMQNAFYPTSYIVNVEIKKSKKSYHVVSSDGTKSELKNAIFTIQKVRNKAAHEGMISKKECDAVRGVMIGVGQGSIMSGIMKNKKLLT